MANEGGAIRRAFREGAAAAAKNLPAILLIQALAIAVAVAYFVWPPMRPIADKVMAVKLAAGLGGAFVAGFVAGGVLPEIAKLLTGRPRLSPADALFVGLVYGVLGVVVDVFYTMQGVWFGHSNDLLTVAKKLAVDMGVFAPLLFVPLSVGALLWKESGFRTAQLRGLFSWKVYRDRVFSIQVMNWLVWVPVLSALYTLPLPLQFPLAMLVEACWSLLMVVMANTEPSKSPIVSV
ncbi:MAG: hypothetical protein KIT11_04610 [Fimbriimonadaceae bacterium]|nr:hypothetical protein [Fimbriimonadaceae bacterium]QYK56824.1 MAG: hypothetical protein KF733_04915 [Fimbriimonadaceae bacterium]